MYIVQIFKLATKVKFAPNMQLRQRGESTVTALLIRNLVQDGGGRSTPHFSRFVWLDD